MTSFKLFYKVIISAYLNISSPSDLRLTLDIKPMFEFSPIFNVTMLALLVFQSPTHVLELKGSRQIFKTNIFLVKPL